jgi:putative transposase
VGRNSSPVFFYLLISYLPEIIDFSGYRRGTSQECRCETSPARSGALLVQGNLQCRMLVHTKRSCCDARWSAGTGYLWIKELIRARCIRSVQHWNVAHQSSGHVWQGRYYSCPLDQTHLWEALRYTELNPVRARLVSEAELWAWSSAASHCTANERDEFLALDAWGRHWTAGTWREYLAEGELESKLAVIRQRTHTGRPLGSAEFVQDLEKATQRQLTLQKRDPVRR